MAEVFSIDVEMLMKEPKLTPNLAANVFFSK